jgi:hypothetical protein
MGTVRFQLYERRLDNCIIARNRCEEGSWGWNYWTKQFTIIMRMMNQELTNGKRN